MYRILFHDGYVSRVTVALLISVMSIFIPLGAQENLIYLEKGILDYSEPGDGSLYNRSSKVFFSFKNNTYEKGHFFFKIQSSYNDIKRIGIINSSDSGVSVKIRFKTDSNLLIGIMGSGGDDYITIPAGKAVSIPVRFFSQDTDNGIYLMTAAIVDRKGRVLDRASGRVYVAGSEPDIAVRHVKTEGLVHTYETVNRGRGVANFSLELGDADTYGIQPAIDHYYFPAGEKIRFSLYPVGPVKPAVSGKFIIKTPGHVRVVPFSIKPPREGRVNYLSLDPIVRLRRKDWYCTNRPVIHFNFHVPYVKRVPVTDAGFSAKFSWLQKAGKAFDTDGNGRVDHWFLVEKGRTIMAGDDYDGDGTIDYFREADSPGRTLNRAFVKINSIWHATNIVNACLVSSFLPFNDGAGVSPHNVEILLNDKVISKKVKVIPAGSSVYRLRVDYLAENIRGSSKNRITISTKHLPDAHYQVNAENTLVLHFSDITIPVISRDELDLTTDKIDAKIRKHEGSPGKKSGDKEKFLEVLKELKARRDKKLKLAIEYLEKNNYKSLDVSGVQYRGLDLGHYSSEIILEKKTLKGIVRNMGYVAAAYSMSLFIKQGKSFKRLSTKTYRFLPPFASRYYSFNVPEFNAGKRTLYKVVLKAVRPRQKELVAGNNTAHLVTGPQPDPKKLKEEMKHLAGEMGLENDRVTLSRPLQVAEHGDIYKVLDDRNTGKRISFSAPVTPLNKIKRTFILE